MLCTEISSKVADIRGLVINGLVPASDGGHLNQLKVFDVLIERDTLIFWSIHAFCFKLFTEVGHLFLWLPARSGFIWSIGFAGFCRFSGCFGEK